MKTEDLIQIGYFGYQKFARAQQPVNTVTPGLQPSSQRVVSTPLDPSFGVQDPNAGWDDDGGGMTFLQKVIEWDF